MPESFRYINAVWQIEHVIAESRKIGDVYHYSHQGEPALSMLKKLGIINGDGFSINRGDFYGYGSGGLNIKVYPVDLDMVELVLDKLENLKTNTGRTQFRYDEFG